MILDNLSAVGFAGALDIKKLSRVHTHELIGSRETVGALAGNLSGREEEKTENYEKGFDHWKSWDKILIIKFGKRSEIYRRGGKNFEIDLK